MILPSESRKTSLKVFFAVTSGLCNLDTGSLSFGEEGEASLGMDLLLY